MVVDEGSGAGDELTSTAVFRKMGANNDRSCMHAMGYIVKVNFLMQVASDNSLAYMN